MKREYRITYWKFIAFALLLTCLSSCSFPNIGIFNSSPKTSTMAPTETVVATKVAVLSTPTPLSPQNTATPEPIIHQATPLTAPTPPHHLWDVDSSANAKKRYPPSGDNFNKALYERPFNAGKQDVYFPEVDIIDSDFQLGTPWVYSSIVLAGVSTTTKKLDGSYAIEVSVNDKGFGDFLIIANQPNVGVWTTDGVQIYQDKNHDVDNPAFTVQNANAGNGFETLIFDEGKGDDGDLAWVKIDSNSPNTLWFAFKSSLINNKSWALRRSLASKDKIDPSKLDYYQFMTEDQAGNPIPNSSNYPLKGLSEMDSTCRVAINFYPNLNVPGLCPIAPTEGPHVSAPNNSGPVTNSPPSKKPSRPIRNNNK